MKPNLEGCIAAERSEASKYAPKPDARNPAMALRFTIEDQWRRVTDLDRSAIP
jgi:hypothetical protein